MGGVSKVEKKNEKEGAKKTQNKKKERRKTIREKKIKMNEIKRIKNECFYLISFLV